MIQEKLKEITSKPKWYAVSDDEKTWVWLINTASRIRKGTAKRRTIEKFFDRFGYKVEFNIEISLKK